MSEESTTHPEGATPPDTAAQTKAGENSASTTQPKDTDKERGKKAEFGQLALVPIGELCQENKHLRFLIPDYQRGYRWTETEVRDLLQDIFEFSEKELASKERDSSSTLQKENPSVKMPSAPILYRLQPVEVVKRKNNRGIFYDLVDVEQIQDGTRTIYSPSFKHGKESGRPSEELLRDLRESARPAHDSESSTEGGEVEEPLYCLQPLVVMERSDKDGTYYEVVDGQQRLTTIRLILGVLAQYDLNQIEKPIAPYALEYQTREDSTRFIESLTSAREVKDSEGNIDYFHMAQATEEIKRFLNEVGHLKKRQFSTALLDHTKFIWYIPEDDGTSDDKAVAVFRRLNVGKISLTSSELIKALLLNRADDEDGDDVLSIWQREIALQWDEIENALGEDEFWYFLKSEAPPPTRIDIIFDLIYKLDPFGEAESYDAYGDYKAFRYIEHYIEKGNGEDGQNSNNDPPSERIKNVWRKVMKVFRLFHEWYRDAEFYHYVGFLLSKDASGYTLDGLIKRWWGITKNVQSDGGADKTKFREYLKESIWATCMRHLMGDICGHLMGDIFVECNNAQTRKGSVSDDAKAPHKRAMCFVQYVRDVVKGNKTDKEDLKSHVESKLKKALGDHDYLQDDKDSKFECRPLLLLHNIQTVVIQNRNERAKYGQGVFYKFPFHLYNQMTWNVEHIDSATPNDMNDPKDQKAWIVNACLFLKASLKGEKKEKFEGKMNVFREGKEDAKDFMKYLQELLNEETLDSKNCVWNFALLDENTNKSYQNDIFPRKRAKLIGRERGEELQEYEWNTDKGDDLFVVKKDASKGKQSSTTFVPPCTMAAFLKKYSKTNATPNQWTKEDASDYLDDICKKLVDFLFTTYRGN